MIRFVLDPDGFLTADLGADLPGRGAWVTASRPHIETALAKNAFARSFRRPAPLADGVSEAAFVDGLEAGLAARALSALGMARRAGALALGFDQVRAALKAGKATVLVTAADAGEDGAGKLSRLAKGLPVVRAFNNAEQSAALGRDGVTHAALLAGASPRFLSEATRLAGFRPVFASHAGDGAGENAKDEDCA